MQTGCVPTPFPLQNPGRSSALASKATGFPIAKMAAKLAVGYTLDQIANDITQKTPASFEPSIDYVVTKVPKFNFEKFPGAQWGKVLAGLPLLLACPSGAYQGDFSGRWD